MEPTDEMTTAALLQVDEWADTREIYSAMLAAAPTLVPVPEDESAESLESLGAPASPSGSTLQPPAAASASIPGAWRTVDFNGLPQEEFPNETNHGTKYTIYKWACPNCGKPCSALDIDGEWVHGDLLAISFGPEKEPDGKWRRHHKCGDCWGNQPAYRVPSDGEIMDCFLEMEGQSLVSIGRAILALARGIVTREGGDAPAAPVPKGLEPGAEGTRPSPVSPPAVAPEGMTDALKAYIMCGPQVCAPPPSPQAAEPVAPEPTPFVPPRACVDRSHPCNCKHRCSRTFPYGDTPPDVTAARMHLSMSEAMRTRHDAAAEPVAPAAQVIEREAFEAWAVRNRHAYHDPQYGLCFYDALPKVIAWKAWTAALRPQAVAPADERLTDEQIIEFGIRCVQVSGEPRGATVSARKLFAEYVAALRTEAGR
jgi:hypothetical protein